MTFRSEELPKFVFIDEDEGEKVLELSSVTPRVRPISALIGSRAERGAAVGLMFPTGPDLVINWLACLSAGVQPLVMQYPTKKQSRDYWAESVRNTIAVAGIKTVIADRNSAGLGLSELVDTITQDELDRLDDGAAEPLTIGEFAIIQLSSGTTGYRKAVRFGSEDLRRHVRDYNASLELTRGDKIVSWLPLYHDMGYVACFVMPMILGIDVVMMDPMTWIRRPELLYDAIDRHSGTICYMPNFGFEVMARCEARRLLTMRRWISCSEPVSADTARKFLDATGTPDECFAPCYAMAENIFAVTFGRGLRTRAIDQANVVSCGTTIPGVSIKVVDKEIWVRSPTSLKSYVDSSDIRDADGFYATGDLGEFVGGELYVTGRKQDLLIQAGRKFMLSDLDLALNQLYPDVRGRAAAVQVYDERLGTQRPVVLIESLDFFVRSDEAEIADALKSATGLDQIEVDFVPPRFLTKTSSGKFNRKKSAADWLLSRGAAATSSADAGNPLAEMRESFATIDWDAPVEEVLDSLSATVLRIILRSANVKYDSNLTLNDFARVLEHKGRTTVRTKTETIHIVSLADRNTIRVVTEKHLNTLERALGCKVSLEHVCLPPSPVILSDLIFHDYFLPRLSQEEFRSISEALGKLKRASLILVDDIAEMFFPPSQVYSVLSHNLERDPLADFIAVRWQRYAMDHHKFPMTVVAGCDLRLDDRTSSLGLLSDYLKKPIFRIATVKAFAKFTEGWDYRSLKGFSGAWHVEGVSIDPDDFVESLVRWSLGLANRLERCAVEKPNRTELSDLPHYCSILADKDQIDKIISRYKSFCITGQSSSVPYIKDVLTRWRKPFIQVPSHAVDVLRGRLEEFECVLFCGTWGPYKLTLPAASIMSSDVDGHGVHFVDPEIGIRTFTRQGYPPSGPDWFYPFATDRVTNRDEMLSVQKYRREFLNARTRNSESQVGRALSSGV